jgi:hypothetical protein
MHVHVPTYVCVCVHTRARASACGRACPSMNICVHYNFKQVYLRWSIHFISVIFQTTGPKPLPKRFLHLMRSRVSSFKWEYPLLSPRSSGNCLRLLPRLLVTSFCPFIFPSITSLRRQFLRKRWPIQWALRFLISCRIFLCCFRNIGINTLHKGGRGDEDDDDDDDDIPVKQRTLCFYWNHLRFLYILQPFTSH